MHGVNLIPSGRRFARRRQKVVRRWSFGVAAYAVALGIAAGWIWIAGRGAQSGLAAKIELAQEQIRVREQSRSDLLAGMARQEMILRVNLAVLDQPDWSTLLALVAAHLGDDVVLESFLLAPPAVTSGRADSGKGASGPPVYRLSIRGFGRSQAAVAEFALALERTRLFSAVKIVETKRTSFLAGEAISFTMECTLEESPGAAT